MEQLLALILLLTVSAVKTTSAVPPDSSPERLSITSSAVRFEERLISNEYGYAFGIRASDLDNDGDMDITSADALEQNNIKNTPYHPGNLYWFENDSQGNFTRHFIQENESGWFERHSIGDVNGDGRQDVVVVKNLDGALVWFQNSDHAPWLQHVISKNLDGAYSVALADLDGDGDLDAAASTWVRNYFAWLENPGKSAVTDEWQKHMIDDQILGTRMIRTADFNADGKTDLLGSARRSDLIMWYEKNAETWIRHIIDAESPKPAHGHAVDMDGDNDADVVVALGYGAEADEKDTHQVAWYENLGNGLQWRKHVIHSLSDAFEARAGDIDGDGDLDVAATAWHTGKVAWYENQGSPRSAWLEHVLKENWDNANQVILADLNSDGRLDIAATADNGSNELRWWKNQGE